MEKSFHWFIRVTESYLLTGSGAVLAIWDKAELTVPILQTEKQQSRARNALHSCVRAPGPLVSRL